MEKKYKILLKLKDYFLENLFCHENELKPMLRFQEFNEDWKQIKGKNIYSIISGGSYKSSDSQKEGIKWLKIKNVGINRLNENDVDYLPLKYKNDKKFLLKKGDIVLALTGTIINSKLKIAIIDNFFNYSLLNQRVGKIDINNKNINKYFIYYYLQTNKTILKIRSKIDGTSPPNLSITDLNEIKFNIPSLNEQNKIVDLLSNIYDKIRFYECYINKLNYFKKYLLQNMFC
ncbi:restriction endonuclease subunit S [Methanobrevibacter sp. 87.7]|uniref:restriction endonuclease subunit S n=1 Tax=Methanobrevibacter sp. 87.7 TaxID=387957 RepID=UPI000B501552|nr:restriction endonuclease subunit S [Methanobrevibacter sp. 87.7]